MKRRLRRSILGAFLLLAAVPGFAGIHYKSLAQTEGAEQAGAIRAEGWVSGDNAKVTFVESAGNPILKEGSFLLTKDGGKTLYLVNPKEKTYAEWSLQGMLGSVGAVMNGIGPLLKVQYSEPKVEKLLDEDGGTVAGLPTRHYKVRTSYSMTVKVLGMSNNTDVVNEQDIWATSRLQDTGLGVWLRTGSPRTGNAEFDKRFLAAEAGKFQGFPLKMITVSTSTAKKGNRTTTTRSTMEVTQLDADAAIPASTFEIPTGFERTEIMAVPTP
jgi:hypothetical protein